MRERELPTYVFTTMRSVIFLEYCIEKASQPPHQKVLITILFSNIFLPLCQGVEP